MQNDKHTSQTVAKKMVGQLKAHLKTSKSNLTETAVTKPQRIFTEENCFNSK